MTSTPDTPAPLDDADAPPPDPGLPPPLRIAAPWMDERSHAMLRDFFRLRLRSRCVLVEPQRAQAILIDLDRGEATRRLAEARARWPEAPVIELSINHTDEALFVHKPLRGRGLARALQAVRRRLQLPEDPVAEGMCGESVAAPAPAPDEPVDPEIEASFIGTARDVDRTEPSDWARAVYRPEDFLQGHLQRAARRADESGRPVALSGVWGRWIIPPGNATVQLPTADRYLRSLCVVEVAPRDVKLETIEQDDALTVTPHAVARDALLWKVALWAARGRMPAEVPLDAPVYLRHWPDLNQLEAIPHAMRIAALWLNHPADVLDLARRLGIAQRYVFAFYSGCAALGLAGPARREADSLVAPLEVSPSGMRALIARLGERLGRGRMQESTD